MRLNRIFYTRTSTEWERLGRAHSLKLFRAVSKRVPAYKDFLKRHKVIPTKIKTWEDFEHLPTVDKHNYLCKYPLEQLCWDGTLSSSLVYAVTSGSTGKPFYFLRDDRLDEQSSVLHELFFRSSGLDPKKSTLVVIGFGMGAWIGGLITYDAFKKMSQRGYTITLITPGNRKQEIFDIFLDVAYKYDQVILCGYPPFIKDVIDEGKTLRIKWNNFNLRILFAAEAFSENFRTYILKQISAKNDVLTTMNIYGTADFGTMAIETPLSIMIRKTALRYGNSLYGALFQDAHRLPTLTQFNPLYTNFESDDGDILITANSALPTIRYKIGDHGGVYKFTDVISIFEHNNIHLQKEITKYRISKVITKMPFVFVYERADLSTKFYGAIIYPEPIRLALQHFSVEQHLTGKFTLQTKYDSQQNQFMEINVELKKDNKYSKSLLLSVEKLIIDQLIEKNAEYRNNFHLMPNQVTPRIVFWNHEHPAFFKPGIKQKWVKK